MTQYDLILSQNVSVAGTEFSEKLVNIGKGDLLSGIATTKVPTVLPAGTNGHQLVRDDAEVTGLKWVAIAAGHTQGTDAGTTGANFTVDSDSTTGKIKIAAVANAGEDHTMTLQNAAMAADVTLTLPATTGTLATQAYADGLFAANDAMLFKGTVGAGGTHEIAAFNSLSTYQVGWTYRVITAGTVKGKVCEIGDVVMALVDRAGSANVDADFTVMQTNLDGAVIGPASATDGHAVVFDGVSGKLVKAHASGALGTAAFTAATAYATSAQGTTADGAIQKSVITAADQVVIGTASATPAVITAGASTIIGKKASGTLGAMSVAETLTVLGVAAGATANTKATGAEIDTGTDDAKFATAKAIADSKLIKGPGTVVDNVPVVWDSTTGKLVKSHASGALGTAAFTAATAYATSAQGSTADGAVPKSLYDAYTILHATSDNTPAALTVGEQTLVGRKTGGAIAALTPAEIMNIIWVTAPATKTAAGTAGQFAKDLNYLYACVSTNVWTRCPMATNW